MVRQRLLEINGIGPETADSMMLYAGGHPSFVIDAYTKRVFLRHGWCRAEDDYDDLKARCQEALQPPAAAMRVDYWQDYHAQLVHVGKDFCRKSQPRCEHCPLAPLLPESSA
jgi:endonuclease-3 related protein